MGPLAQPPTAHAATWQDVYNGGMEEIERAVKRTEEGEAWEETDEVVEMEVQRPLAKVVPIRLPAEKWEELRHEGRELGVGPTTLVRMWILEKLRQVLLARRWA